VSRATGFGTAGLSTAGLVAPTAPAGLSCGSAGVVGNPVAGIRTVLPVNRTVSVFMDRFRGGLVREGNLHTHHSAKRHHLLQTFLTSAEMGHALKFTRFARYFLQIPGGVSRR